MSEDVYQIFVDRGAGSAQKCHRENAPVLENYTITYHCGIDIEIKIDVALQK